MKNLTLIFLYKIINDEIFILMGKNFKLNKLNGFGGKVENNESILDCAERELKEELNILIEKKNLIEVGKIIHEEKSIYIYIYEFEKVTDNFNYKKDEIYDVSWKNIRDKDIFTKEMFSGDEILIYKLEDILINIKNKKIFEKFILNKNGDDILKKQVENIYK